MAGKNPKGYNNDKDWEKMEKSDPKIINNDDYVEFENLKEPDKNIEINSDAVDEVLQLTEFNGGSDTGIMQRHNSDVGLAEYNDIKPEVVKAEHKAKAKSFVNKVVKFISNLDDGLALSTEHVEYLKNVAEYQINNLEDLASMVDMNRQMLNNIIARVNMTMAEDYSIINTYSALINTHLKLMKDLENSYKSIPTVLRKMKTDIFSETEELDNQNNTITDKYGDTQFNDGKHFLETLIKEKEQEQNNNQEETEYSDIIFPDEDNDENS